MTEAALIFLGICIVMAAFIIVSVRAFQINPDLVKKIFKYMLISAIALAFSLAAVGIGLRLSERNSSSFSKSYRSVSEIWGGEISQKFPSFQTSALVEEQYLEKDGQYKTRMKKVYTQFGFTSHAAEITVHSNIRQKGLLKFAGYTLGFNGHYQFSNTEREKNTFYFTFSLPDNAGNITDLKVLLNGKEYTADTDFADGIDWSGILSSGENISFDITYAAQGTGSFRYDKTSHSALEDKNDYSADKIGIEHFSTTLKTDFKDVTILDGSMAPQESHSDSTGSLLSWKGTSLILSQGIGIKFEIRSNYGMLFSKIFFYAPLVISLFLAFMLIFTASKGIRLHPMHYCFIMAGFFVFYLLGSYLVSYIHIFPAIALSLAVSTAITWYYSRATGKGKDLERVTLLCMIVFQWFFSVTFFFPEHTGILITAASIIALVVLMKLTAKTDWDGRW